MPWLIFLICFLSSVCISGCDADYTNEGDGSGSLEVIGHLQHDSTADVQATTARITVSKQGQTITQASVLIIDDDDQQTQYHATYNAAEKAYITSIPNYPRHVRLMIRNNLDYLNCQLTGPSPHTIKQHIAHVAFGDNIDVHWISSEGLVADEVSIGIQSPGKDSVVATLARQQDTGVYTFPSANKILPIHQGPAKIYVARRNKVIPAGGLGASVLVYEYSATAKLMIN